MASHDYTDKAYCAQEGNWASTKEFIRGHNIVIERAFSTATYNLTSGDDYDMIQYPDHSLIFNGYLITTTAEGATGTIDLRDNASPTTTMINDHDLNTDNTIGAYTTALWKPSAEQINILVNNNLDTAVFKIVIDMTVLSAD